MIYKIMKINLIIAVIAVGAIFFQSCEEEDKQQENFDLLVNSGWWNDDDCGIGDNALYFDADGSGWVNVAFCSSSKDCFEWPYFNWSVTETGVVTVSYTEKGLGICDGTFIPYTETTTMTTESIFVYGLLFDRCC